jgi:hypothetical protein
MKYSLDATKERLEKAPHYKAKITSGFILPGPPSQSSFIGTLSGLPNPMKRYVEYKRVRFDGSGRIVGSQFRFSRPVQAILALLASFTVERI